MNTATLLLKGKEYELPVIEGSEGETAIDVTSLRAKTGAITFDPGYANTGSCASAITFIDGENGILRYRGYPIEELARKATFVEVCYLLIHGNLPSTAERIAFDEKLTRHSLIHEDMKKFFEGFPPSAHPMAILSAMVASLSAYYPNSEDSELNIIRLLSKAKTIAAFSYKKSVGQPFIYPRNDLTYTQNFMHMMFAVPAENYVVSPAVDRALNLLLILHADHEQNCSTSTVRMVGSSGANLFASISAGICALWGPLHGGANQQVIEMLQQIRESGQSARRRLGLRDGHRCEGDEHHLLGIDDRHEDQRSDHDPGEAVSLTSFPWFFFAAHRSAESLVRAPVSDRSCHRGPNRFIARHSHSITPAAVNVRGAVFSAPPRLRVNRLPVQSRATSALA